MTKPEFYADHGDGGRSGAVEQLMEWLRLARAAQKRRREEQRYQAFLRSVDPAVLQDVGYEVPSDRPLAKKAARLHLRLVPSDPTDHRD